MFTFIIIYESSWSQATWQFQNPAKQYWVCFGKGGEGRAEKSCGQKKFPAIGPEAREAESISVW